MNKNIKILVASLICSLTFTYINANATRINKIKDLKPNVDQKVFTRTYKNKNTGMLNKYTDNKSNNNKNLKINTKYGNVENIDVPTILKQIDLRINEINNSYSLLLNKYENNIPKNEKRSYNRLIAQLNEFYNEKYNELNLKKKFLQKD